MSYGLQRGDSNISRRAQEDGEPGRGVWRIIHRRGATKRASVRSTRSDTQERAARPDVVRRVSESAMMAPEFEEVSNKTHAQVVTIPLEEITVHN